MREVIRPKAKSMSNHKGDQLEAKHEKPRNPLYSTLVKELWAMRSKAMELADRLPGVCCFCLARFALAALEWDRTASGQPWTPWFNQKEGVLIGDPGAVHVRRSYRS